jgi:hypothetical protein
MRTFILLFIAITLTVGTASAWTLFGDDSGNYTSIDELTEAVANEVKSRYAGKRFYLNREDIRSQTDNAILPFSNLLESSLERAMGRVGVVFIPRETDNVGDMQLKVSFSLMPDKVSINVRFKNHLGDYSLLSAVVPLSSLPPDLFVEGVDERIGRLAEMLARPWTSATVELEMVFLELLLQPLVNAEDGSPSDFARYATDILRSSLKARNISVREKQTQTRGISALNPDAPLICGDIRDKDIDALLIGTIRESGDTVTLQADIWKKGVCKVIASGKVNIPRQMIKQSLKNELAEKGALYADTKGHNDGGMVRLSTSAGGGNQVFYAGDTYTLTAWVKTPLYFYLYDFYPNGDVELLYPMEGETEILRKPGIKYEIPEESSLGGGSLTVQPKGPFGIDVNKLFASDRKLPLPKLDKNIPSRSFNGTTRNNDRQNIQADLARRPAINPADLVDYYRGTAARLNARLYESYVFIETRPKEQK